MEAPQKEKLLFELGQKYIDPIPFIDYSAWGNLWKAISELVGISPAECSARYALLRIINDECKRDVMAPIARIIITHKNAQRDLESLEKVYPKWMIEKNLDGRR